MPYFWDELDFLVGGRLTSLSYMWLRQWPVELDDEIVVLGQFVQLPQGEHVDVEEDFLGSHLPYRRAAFGGRDAEDDLWLFSIQAVPRPVVRDAFGAKADPYEVMRDGMANALVYNAGARVTVEGEWSKDDLIDIYCDRDIDRRRVAGWRTFDLLRGLLAELADVSLSDVVAGYPACAFPNEPHACQHDVFDDSFAAWCPDFGADGVQAG